MKYKLMLLLVTSFLLVSMVSAVVWDNTAYYELNGTSGLVVDSTGNGYDGTNVNGSRGFPGIINNSFDLNGTVNSHFIINDSVSDNFTTTMWINWEETNGGAGAQRLLSSSGGLDMYIEPSTDKIIITAEIGSLVYTSTNIIALNEFVHIAYVCSEGNNESLYINGIIDGSQLDACNITSQIRVGSIHSIGTLFDGRIDELGIWNRSMQAGEIKGLYAGGSALIYNSTLNVGLENPSNNSIHFSFGSINSTIEFNSSGINANNTLSNATLYIYNSTGLHSNQVNSTISSLSNQTRFTAGPVRIDEYIWNVEYCTTENYCTFALDNRTFESRGFIENSQTFNSSSIEGSTEPFAINITYNSTFHNNILVRLNYNNIYFSATSSQSGDTREFSSTVNSPSVSALTNISFFWEINLIGDETVQYNTTDNNQSVANLAIDDCSVYTILLLNYSLKDEVSQVVINGATFNTSVEVDVDIYPVGSRTPIIEFSQNYSGNNNPQVCLQNDLGDTSYEVDVQTVYGGDDYQNEFYHLQNFSLTNSTLIQNIDLFDIKTAVSQRFKITFKDENFLAVEDAIIQIQRKYISEGVFKTIEISKTDESGEATGSFELDDVVYTLIVSKNGETLGTFDNVIAQCQNADINSCEINLNSFSSAIEPKDYTVSKDFSYTYSYNSSNREVSAVYTIPSGGVSLVVLNVTLIDGLGSTTACLDSISSSSGTLTCTIPQNLGNGTAIATLTKDGDRVGQALVDLEQEPEDLYGANLVFLGLFLIVTVLGLGIGDNPMITGVFLIIGAVLLIAFNLIDTGVGTFVKAGATIMWIIVAIVLVLIKGSKR